MSAIEVRKMKLDLIAWVDQLSDNNLLMFLDGLKNASSEKDWWDELSVAQRKNILLGLNDSKKGKLHNSEEFWKQLKDA